MNYRWVDLLGNFEDIDGGRVFLGREYDDPIAQTDALDKQGEPSGPPVDQPAVPQKKVWAGQSICDLCDQYFKEGVIKVEIEFEELDWRCMADIILQYDPSTDDMLSFSLGGGAPEVKGGNSFAVRLWTNQPIAADAPRWSGRMGLGGRLRDACHPITSQGAGIAGRGARRAGRTLRQSRVA